MEGNLENNLAMYKLKGKVYAIPPIDETLTKQGYAADSKVVGEALGTRVKTSEIVDNLTSEDVDKPLSARQGKIIKEQIDKINLSQAGTVGYNNSISGLNATNMQSGLDEVAQIAKDALPKSGGKLEGELQVGKADNGYGSLMKNHSAKEDYGTQLIDVAKNGRTAKLSISALLGTLAYVDEEGNIRNIYHEGTKPFGNYIGNGSARPRTVATKGIGIVLVVYCSSHIALVTPKGALVVDLTTREISWMDSAKVLYANGNLAIETANAAFNTNGTTYYYQAI